MATIDSEYYRRLLLKHSQRLFAGPETRLELYRKDVGASTGDEQLSTSALSNLIKTVRLSGYQD